MSIPLAHKFGREVWISSQKTDPSILPDGRPGLRCPLLTCKIETWGLQQSLKSKRTLRAHKIVATSCILNPSSVQLLLRRGHSKLFCRSCTGDKFCRTFSNNDAALRNPDAPTRLAQVWRAKFLCDPSPNFQVLLLEMGPIENLKSKQESFRQSLQPY